MKKLFLLSVILILSLNVFAQKWDTIQPNILYAEDKDKNITNVKVGIGTKNPVAMLDVMGQVQSLSMKAQQADFATAVVTGQITAGSLTVSGGAVISGTLTTGYITSTIGSIDFGSNNLSTTGNFSAVNITTQQLTISGGMLESDTIHAGRTLSVNNSLKLERQTSNNFAEVSTIDTSVALVLQRDTTGRGVGIGTTPYAGEKLSVAGDVGIINGNLRLSNLAGIGDRQLLIDGSGNLKSGNPAPLFGCAGPWCINGNQNTNPSTDFLGTTDAQDLIFKTDASGTGGERMRIMANGDVRFIVGGGNVMIKTDFGPGGAAEAKVGIGTENPVRSLHVYTTHYPDNPPPPCPNNDPNCIPSQGSHMGVRLDDLTQIGNLTPVRTIWDIAPYYNPAIASSGSLVIGKGNLTDESIDSKMILLDNGNVGIGTTTPAAPLEVKGSISIYDGNANTSLFFAREQVSNNTFGKWGIQYVPVGTLSAQAKGGLNFWIPAAPGNNFGNNYLFLADDGKVGIGTNNPSAQLTIQGSGNTNSTLSLNVRDNSGNPLLLVRDGGSISIGTIAVPSRLSIQGSGNTINTSSLNVSDNNGNSLFNIKDDGKVSIGVPDVNLTTNSGNYKLYVAGGIITERSRVTLQNSGFWGDWVFNKDNKRMTPEEQAKYYFKNKHLKWIPSVAELKKNGIDVEEMFTGVIINLEEARLDIIDLSNENKQLKKENEELRNAINEIKNELKKLAKHK